MYVKKAELGSAFFVGENKGFWRFVENNYMCEGKCLSIVEVLPYDLLCSRYTWEL